MQLRKGLAVLAAVAALSSLTGAMAVVGSTPAGATPQVCGTGCVHLPPPPPTTLPPCTAPTVSSISPDLGWAGDSVGIYGSCLGGATRVTFGGVAATFTDNGTSIATTVPTAIPDQVSGPDVISVSVVTPLGTVTSPFTVSPALQADVTNTWNNGDPAGWNQGNPINASETVVTVDRESGLVNEATTVSTSNQIESFSVAVSVLYADSSGKIIGFSTPYQATVTPPAFAWLTQVCDGPTACTATVKASDTVQPLQEAALIHSIQVVQVYESSASLEGTLSNLLSQGATVAKALQVLASLM
jgi:hypothetical protein